LCETFFACPPQRLASTGLAQSCFSAAINGFRNRDLQGKLYSAPANNPAEIKRRTHRTSRLIAKLRGHGLIAKVTNSRLYRVTQNGVKAMWAAVRCRRIDFPAAFNMSESFAQ
jgi:hypothetical protein